MIERYIATRKQVEHSISAHLIRRTAWLQREEAFSAEKVLNQWIDAGTRLIDWVVFNSAQLESLCITFPVSVTKLFTILSQTSNLKHFTFFISKSLISDESFASNEDAWTVHLPKIETFIFSTPVLLSSDSVRMLNIFLSESISWLSVQSTRLLKTEEYDSEIVCPGISIYTPNVSHPKALDIYGESLEGYVARVDFFEMLSLDGGIETSRLAYLKLLTGHEGVEMQLLIQFLSKCPNLRILILPEGIHMTREGFRVLGDNCPLLEVLWVMSALRLDETETEIQSMLDNLRCSKTNEGTVLDFTVSSCKNYYYSRENPVDHGVKFVDQSVFRNLPRRYKLWHPYMKNLLQIERRWQ